VIENHGSAGAPPLASGRPPQAVRQGLWLFAPNRDSQGGSSWWLTWSLPDGGVGLLIDCPALTEANLAFLRERGPGWIVLTGREGHGRCRRLQEALGWPVWVQEQEAYLLPGLQQLHTFGAELELAPGLRLLWTPGPTPGSSVLLAEPAAAAEAVLFCGRLLSPLGPSQVGPLRTSRSFHWRRWLLSLERLQAWLPPGSPGWLASGAGLGALRGAKLIPEARHRIDALDLAGLAAASLPPPL
jgi:glyoxylase-like metal-dependent hydrolase (beta-lactamase superfamily II)